MKYKITLADGTVMRVDAPPGASREQILSIAQSASATAGVTPKAAETPAPDPNAGLDTMGRVKRGIVEGVRGRTGGEVTGQELATAEPRSPSGFMSVVRSIPQFAAEHLIPGSNPELVGSLATLPFGGGLVSAPLKRTLAAGAGAGLTSTLQGDTPQQAAKTALGQMAAQAFGEVPTGAVRAGLYQRSGNRLLGEREAAAAADQSRYATDKAMYDALSSMEKKAYDDAVAAYRASEAGKIRDARAQHLDVKNAANARWRASEDARQQQYAADVADAKTQHVGAQRRFAEDAASQIADAYRNSVSAFRDFASGTRGLLDMVYGRGPAALSAKFDEALKRVVDEGRGRPLRMRASDADALGLKVNQWEDSAAGPKTLAFVDAGEAAARVTGQWTKNPGLYRRVVGALDEAGIGDPVARAEYKAGQALIRFTDATKMLEGEVFRPERAQAGFTRLKTVDELRRRGEGHIFEGPMQAVRGGPGEFTPPPEPLPTPKPMTPAFRRPAPDPAPTPPPTRVEPFAPAERPMPEGVSVTTLPKIGFFEAGVPLEVVTRMMGGPAYEALAAGGLAGRLLSERNIITKAPISPFAEGSLRVAAPEFGEFARSVMPGASQQ